MTAETPNVTLSDNAAKRVAFLMSQEGGDDVFLRIAVIGGGCSGFQYTFDFDDVVAEDDVVLEKDGAKVCIDSVSVNYMEGAEIDFVQDLIGSAFAIKNPTADASCSCGNSFSV